MAKVHSNLRVKHITTLPPDWLGKNHALHNGAAEAHGKWILFTDADVHFEANALRKALTHAEAQNLDHLAALPVMQEHGTVLGVSLSVLMTLSMVFLKPWRVANPAYPNYYCGFGPFNLVKRESYLAREGHSKILMRPDDDIMLGKLMKSQGGRSEYVFSGGACWFSWYENVGQLIDGLSKNTYASVEYSPVITFISVLIHFFTFAAPALALLLTSGYAWWLFLGAFALQMIVTLLTTHRIGGTLSYAFLTPLGTFVIIYIMLRSMVLTHKNHGIIWRGTVYSLDKLKKNKLE
jgi:glycosyltransferase involved in cell wall biosynthesis